mmetsp:Transcript_7266/g.10631  ORF Transcript_7266/g.10631 Transcript_7266/m.10631 type:complete len:1184 (+) Transcript_7266:279-3830(+)|eukprot:CAMPEP_0194199594 /NCGR_PEP_ID=MMETSP0156-20130528/558_1 /TAXON_ID=33649 /ORGANISM="Thalassionema nitzschioides, Strain L26-B" /LENGTH=1183 /DNA_ID=CAMNT_0038924517 /DNA_START=216 /DNA_END=3767 /DNA_ORIENTATION=+
MVEIRQVLLDAVEGHNSCQVLVDLFWNHSPEIPSFDNGREQRAALLSEVSAFSKAHARRFFHAIDDILNKIVKDEMFVPESAYEDDEGGTMTVSDVQSTSALLFIKATAFCIEKHIVSAVKKMENKRSSSNPRQAIPVLEEVMAVMEKLHDSLFTLQSCGGEGLSVQQKICNVCELWWNEDIEEKEYMVVQFLPLLLAKTLDETVGTKADVKRLFNMRDALQLFDFDCNSSSDLKSLLLRAVSSPAYLKTNEGRRLIAYLYQLSFPEDLFKAMRVQIPDAKKIVLESYSEILFRAWKDENATLDDVEKNPMFEPVVLQDLSYNLLHVANPTMKKNLSIILHPFHQAKKTPEVQKLLHRLYGPILWRSLRAASPRVRVQAAHVLSMVFPLPDGVNVQKAMEKATAALIKLLNDVDPRVRVSGSSAACTVLATYWDAIPATDIRIILRLIVEKHANDISSSAVRAGALSAISMLLEEAEESHAALRGMLPLLGDLIHDKVERVRLATVKLLQTLKTIPGIKYYHVVPVHHLLARMADDGHKKMFVNPVSSAITALMQNSYFPQNLSGSEQAHRTLSFLASDPMAASVFYSNLSAHLSVNSVAKLAAMLMKCLFMAVENDQPKSNNGKRRRNSLAKCSKNGLTACNTSLMVNVAETICCLWESIEEDLLEPEYEPINTFLSNSFSGSALSTVYSYFDGNASINAEDTEQTLNSHRICAALLRCAGRLDQKRVQGLTQQITAKLSCDEASHDLTPHVALLCLWGKTEEVIETLSASIIGGLCTQDDTFEDPDLYLNKAAGGNKAETTIMPQLEPYKAMEVIDTILRGEDPSSIAARKVILESECQALYDALEKGIHFAERLLQSISDHPNVTLILQACETYGRLALHKHATDDVLNQQAKRLLNWTTDQVIPALQQPFLAPTPFRELDLSRISNVSDTTPGSPIRPQAKRIDRKRTPNRNSIQTEYSFVDMAHCSAISLLDSSCIIFSEWLAVGGSGAEDIAIAASTWCRAACTSQELMSSFLRLAVQLSAHENNLLWETLLLQPPQETALFKKAFALCLAGANLSGLCNSFIQVARVILQEPGKIGDSPEEGEPSEIQKNLGSNNYMAAAFEVISSHRKASIVFVQSLVRSLNQTCDDSLNSFKVRCVAFLLDGSLSATWIKKILNSSKEGGEMQDLVNKMKAIDV